MPLPFPWITQDEDRTILEKLQNHAIELGAESAVLLDTHRIITRDDLAALCKKPGCPNYGIAASCPPYVGGPQALLQDLEHYTHALFFRVHAPKSQVFSAMLPEIMGQVHTIAASLEYKALELGFSKAKAFAGGSCKNIFCQDQPDCQVVAQNGPCRNPTLARPSMSGFGIDVSALATAAGWPMLDKNANATMDDAPMPLYGLVIMG
ncbi:MAG: DUF2284 domain-containing protein [Desulfatibacillum sp.]|nr:DUF2284 domain-containing protein [Desulfatibacillum sp.]